MRLELEEKREREREEKTINLIKLSISKKALLNFTACVSNKSYTIGVLQYYMC
jgi:hypothetical protein